MKITLRNILALTIALLAVSVPFMAEAKDGGESIELNVQSPQIKVNGSSVVIDIPNDATYHVAIYALTGQVVKQFDASQGSTSVDLPSGYYLVRVGHTTVKIAVK